MDGGTLGDGPASVPGNPGRAVVEHKEMLIGKWEGRCQGLEMVSLLQACAGDVYQRGGDRPHNGTGLDSVSGRL